MILGVDWGQRKIGLAIAHEDLCIATVFATVKNDARVFDEIKSIVSAHDVTKIVIGKSVHISQNDNVRMIEDFGVQCEKKCGVPVVYVTEMFTTREAKQNLMSAGKKRIDQKDDAEAARIILQQYLDAQNHTI